MNGSDEPFRFDHDVEVDGCCNGDVVGSAEAAKVQ